MPRDAEAQREYQREYRQRPYVRAKERARSRRREKADPHIARKRNARRRARKYGAYVERVEPLVVLELDDGVCGICGEDVDPERFEIDHVLPLACGGQEAYYNVQLAHPACNARKHVRSDVPLLPDSRAGRRHERILRRDEQIVEHLLTGAAQDVVAAALGISRATVAHRVRVMRADGRAVLGRKRGQRDNPHLNRKAAA